jgi:hypothetical protein
MVFTALTMPSPPPPAPPSQEEYAAATKLNYRKALAEQYKKGDLLFTDGEITTRLDGKHFVLDTLPFPGLSGNKVLVLTFNEPQGFIAGDQVTVKARFWGYRTLKNALGGKKKVPDLLVDYAE